MYPAYVLGEAYLALADGASAATEFKMFIDIRGYWGIVLWRAKTVYEDFLALDPETALRRYPMTRHANTD